MFTRLEDCGAFEVHIVKWQLRVDKRTRGAGFPLSSATIAGNFRPDSIKSICWCLSQGIECIIAE